MSGQINRGSEFGEIIYKLSLIPEFKTFLDIGTWKGQGSIKCFADGVLSRQDNSCVYSIEANEEFYKEALEYWDPILITYFIPKVRLLYGKLIDVEELTSEEEVRQHKDFNQHPWLEWRKRNIEEYKVCPNIMSLLPQEIDVALFDGGNFSTYQEYQKLKDRTKVVLLDDSLTMKTDRIREELISSSDWETIRDDSGRQGFYVACMKDYSSLLQSLS